MNISSYQLTNVCEWLSVRKFYFSSAQINTPVTPESSLGYRLNTLDDLTEEGKEDK